MITTGKKVNPHSSTLQDLCDCLNLSSDDDNDVSARKAFESVLRVSLLQPTSPRFHNFSEIVRKRAAENYNFKFVEGEEVS